MNKYIPFVKDLVLYYYNELDNSTGGYLHIVLDDGNTEKENILWCRNECENNSDTFGIFLCDVLMCCSESELVELYKMSKLA